MNRPSLQFYPRDFLSDENVILMTLEERGAYITLLCLAWMEGSIPADVTKLARLCGVDGEAMARLWPALKPCFGDATDNPTRLVNPRLEKERQKQDEYRQKLSDAGKAGAKAKQDKEKENPSEAQATLKPPHKPRHPSSSSSSPAGRSARTTAKEPVNSQQRLAETYRRLWTTRYPDGTFTPLTKTDFIILADLVRDAGGEEKVDAALHRFFDDTAAKVVDAAHPLPWLKSGFRQYSRNGNGHIPTAPLTETKRYNF